MLIFQGHTDTVVEPNGEINRSTTDTSDNIATTEPQLTTLGFDNYMYTNVDLPTAHFPPPSSLDFDLPPSYADVVSSTGAVTFPEAIVDNPDTPPPYSEHVRNSPDVADVTSNETHQSVNERRRHQHDDNSNERSLSSSGSNSDFEGGGG